MKKNFYAILDVYNGYGMPIIQDNDGTAMRNFQNACCDKSSVYATHSADFSLWCVGAYDSDSGELIPEPARKICSAYDFVATLNEDYN